MNEYKVKQVKDTRNGNRTYSVLLCNDDVVLEASRYLKHETEINRSPNTVKIKAQSLCYYFNYLDKLGLTPIQVMQMNRKEQDRHFSGFLNIIKKGGHCSNSRNPANKTCNMYLQNVFGFYEFLFFNNDVKEGLKVLRTLEISYIGAGGKRFERAVKHFDGYLKPEKSKGETINEETLAELINQSPDIRLTLMIQMLADTGIRIGELLGINYVEDIDYEERTIRIRFREDNENYARGKNAEDRTVMYGRACSQYLREYITRYHAQLQDTEYLFVSRDGKALTSQAVYAQIDRLSRRTGIKVHPHMLRHYFANERRKAGWSLLEISHALGHRSIETTRLYLNIEEDEMMDVMEEYFRNQEELYDL